MSRAYLATWTDFIGSQYECHVIAYSMEEAHEIASAYMCDGDLLTIEIYREVA